MNKSYSKILSCTTVMLIYLLSLVAIYFVYPFINHPQHVIRILIADVIATGIVFTFSVIFNNSSIYDAYWSVAPPVIVIHLMFVFPEGNYLRQMIVLGLVSFWAVRLTLNWARGWQGLKHQDWRYTNISNKTGKLYWPVSFLGIHLMPTLFVFMGCLPLWHIFSSAEPINIFDLIAFTITFAAILVEWISDEQMIRFRKNRKPEQFIKNGLWAYSRHPNYLGEIVFWIGIFLFALSSNGVTNSSVYPSSIGLFSMIILFNFISIPMMEKRNLERKPDYSEYVKTVPALFPLSFRKKL